MLGAFSYFMFKPLQLFWQLVYRKTTINSSFLAVLATLYNVSIGRYKQVYKCTFFVEHWDSPEDAILSIILTVLKSCSNSNHINYNHHFYFFNSNKMNPIFTALINMMRILSWLACRIYKTIYMILHEVAIHSVSL